MTGVTGRREVLLGGVFTALAAGCVFLRPRRAFARLSGDTVEGAIPLGIGPYVAQGMADFILPPADELSTRLYDRTVMRVYEAPGLPPVMAVFAYGSAQNLTLELHRPDECYPMQGFALTPLERAPIAAPTQAIPAELTTATRPGRTEQVLFWSRIGDAFPATRTDQSIAVATENLSGRMPDGMLVRLSVVTPDRAAALAQMRGFAGALFGALPPLGRRLILGPSAGVQRA